LYGEGAHTNTLACVEHATLELAGRRVDHSPHSIRQLVYHMNFWMAYELKRIRGEKPVYPEHASESWPENVAPASELEWGKAVTMFRDLLADLARLADSSPDLLAEEVVATHQDHTKRSSTLRAVLWQTLVHNSYHTGQIAMLRRALDRWPPTGGEGTAGRTLARVRLACPNTCRHIEMVRPSTSSNFAANEELNFTGRDGPNAGGGLGRIEPGYRLQ
jgi:uncharacterized damage-inducible protein DinB